MEFDPQALLRIFVADADEHLTAMEQALVALERRPDDDEVKRELFRRAHSLKGDASCVGLEHVTKVAHELENLLERIHDDTVPVSERVITLLLGAVDRLSEMVAAAAAGRSVHTWSYSGLIAEIGRVIERHSRDTQSPGDASPEPSPAVENRGDEGAAASRRMRTLRVDIDKLDRMLNLTGEILIARGRARGVIDELGGAVGERIREVLDEADGLYTELQDLVMKARMVAIGPVFRQHFRTVRDVAASCGKVARLVVQGADVEVDTAVVEQLREPLIHLIRNAVDHGIELPEIREAMGKEPCGVITLRARHRTGFILIEVSDDGAGLERDRIASIARGSGLIDDPDKLSDVEISQLIFEPGLSTAAQVTELSGRGLGMDIVRRQVQALRGSVSVTSESGRGTTMTLRVPLTLAIIDGFEVGVADGTYIIPMDSVVECVDLPPAERGRARGVLQRRGRALPYMRLRSVLGVAGEPESRECVVVVRDQQREIGLAVDMLRGEGQTVIKPLGELFRAAPGLAGAAILGSGRIALILDIPALFEEVPWRALPGRSRSCGSRGSGKQPGPHG